MTEIVGFLLFILAVVGMTHIIVDSTIISPIRALFKKYLPEKIASMIECYQCTGTWAGFLCGYLLFEFSLPTIFLSGCAGSFLATLGAAILNYLEAKTVVDLGE